MTLDDLFAGRLVVSTPEAAEFVGISESEAREWAADNAVDRAGFSYAWSEENVEDLAEEFDDEEDGSDVFAENPVGDDDDDDLDDDDDDLDDDDDDLDDDDDDDDLDDDDDDDEDPFES